ncbi:MAG: sigma-70 family RNA polymerase sigma factor [Sphingomonadaceae bacterium]|nr:sigma-70 family RNA polymerase sigma factor [Sphingomonadaceae bacterium]
MTLSLSEGSDAELAALALGGRQDAFRALLVRHRDAVFRLVRASTGDEHEALDITQETFVAAFSALARYDGARPFAVWLRQIALNKCRDWARRRAVRSLFRLARPIEADDDFESDDPRPDREAEARSELRAVKRAIADLPQSLREVTILRAVEELSQAETAHILGISEKAVETRLYRARAQLKAGLSGTIER